MLRSTSSLVLVAALATLSFVSACGGEPQAAKAPEGAKAGGTEDPAGKTTAETKTGGDSGTTAVLPGGDDRFSVEVVAPEGVKVGSAASVTVKVTPNAPWHMNLDYPTSLKVDAPAGITLSKAEFKKGDAAKLDETGCEYKVDVTPSSEGAASVPATFKFAICQDDACLPIEENVEIKLAATI